jgi:hypothetical protein
MCRNRAHASQQESSIRSPRRASEQQGRQLQAELPCGFLVHEKLKFGWGLEQAVRDAFLLIGGRFLGAARLSGPAKGGLP